jgi:serine phosphatase RsbU (regulator of sigma subunit)
MVELPFDQVPLLTSLPKSEREELVASLLPVTLPQGALLFREGDPGDSFCAIVNGQVEILKALGTEDERLLRVQGPGTFLGEVSLLEQDGLRTASVRTRTPVTLLTMSRADFQALLQRRPALAVELLRVVSRRLHEADAATIRDLNAKNVQLTQAYANLQAAQEQIVEKEKLELELRLAHKLQQSILPQEMPILPGYSFAAMMAPARAVGGDFFDFIPLSGEALGIVVADVSDKGMSAAIFMALTCSLVRAEASRGVFPAEVLRRVNHHLLAMNQAEMFVTVLYGILHGKTGEFLYARAGHELPIVLDAAGEAVAIPHGRGQLLGILPNPDLDEQMITVPRGGRLLLCTDGVADAVNTADEQFGHERMLAAAQQISVQSAQSLCDGLQAALLAFQGDAVQFDDITLVVVQAGTSSIVG